MTCAKSASACKVLLCAKSSDDRVVMCVGDDTSVCGKKLTVKIGDNSLALTCFDDRVRVRGEDLKATADYIRSERKDCLILEGDVVLHYKKDGHTVNVTGDCIELNLSSGAVTIKPAE
jgi:predicted ThiF/HesA family dinucleotide-utilizing enzyme